MKTLIKKCTRYNRCQSVWVQIEVNVAVLSLQVNKPKNLKNGKYFQFLFIIISTKPLFIKETIVYSFFENFYIIIFGADYGMER